MSIVDLESKDRLMDLMRTNGVENRLRLIGSKSVYKFNFGDNNEFLGKSMS